MHHTLERQPVSADKNIRAETHQHSTLLYYRALRKWCLSCFAHYGKQLWGFAGFRPRFCAWKLFPGRTQAID
jgi:hypothetical protein